MVAGATKLHQHTIRPASELAFVHVNTSLPLVYRQEVSIGVYLRVNICKATLRRRGSRAAIGKTSTPFLLRW